jgi:2-polyprenyl-6-methoxyphenol hydroxylase-like FAD-dependent oxidoreductase
VTTAHDRISGFDFVVVGGGIAGGTFATVMSRAGASVLLLERQSEYRDRVRGELIWPWGVAEVQRLGLEDVLLAAGANVADRFLGFDEGRSEPAVPIDLSAEAVGAPGSLNLFHPAATRALAESANAAGTRVVFGARDIAIETALPAVSWTDGDGRHRVACRLVIGADGRSSTVRAQAGVELHKDPTAHLATGLLVEGLDEVDERTNLSARASDVLFLPFRRATVVHDCTSASRPNSARASPAPTAQSDSCRPLRRFDPSRTPSGGPLRRRPGRARRSTARTRGSIDRSLTGSH